MDHQNTQSFSTLGLPEALLTGIREAGFSFCTPIQAATLPLALKGQDVAGQAQTGTGKTAAFLLATFNHLLTHAATGMRTNQPRALILSPTRELAIQIYNDAQVLGKHTHLTLGLVYGGTGYESQRIMLSQGVDVLIGTPGRLIDYFKQQIFDLKAIQVMVLDEADRMFDLGFIKDIRFLLRRMPPPTQRLGMLFSATLSYRVNELAYEHMNNPTLIKIESDKVTADKVSQIVYHTANEEKLALLVGLLRQHGTLRSLVFTNTKGAAQRVETWLAANGFDTAVLSGDVPQTKRQRLLQDFQKGKYPVLIATDVAARGLHIPEVSHVFNFDLPQDPEDYVHRIGRTARAGASGAAISFACEEYAFSLLDIETYIGHKISVGRITPDMIPTLTPPAEQTRRGAEKARMRREKRPGHRHLAKTSPRHPVAETVVKPQVPLSAPVAKNPDPSQTGNQAKAPARPPLRKRPEKPAIG